MSRCLHFKLSVLGVLRDHILRVTQLGHSREYSRINQLFTHAFLGNSSDPGVLRDNSSVAGVNGVKYKVTCHKCLSVYIGSTIRFLHDRINEHISSSNSSIYKHLFACNNNKKNLQVDIIDRERDPFTFAF